MLGWGYRCGGSEGRSEGGSWWECGCPGGRVGCEWGEGG